MLGQSSADKSQNLFNALEATREEVDTKIALETAKRDNCKLQATLKRYKDLVQDIKQRHQSRDEYIQPSLTLGLRESPLPSFETTTRSRSRSRSPGRDSVRSRPPSISLRRNLSCSPSKFPHQGRDRMYALWRLLNNIAQVRTYRTLLTTTLKL
jgi:hypothetical protein